MMSGETPAHNGDPSGPSFWAQWGITPRFVDEEGVEGPPVDREKLERYARRELGPHAQTEVTDLISTFRTWYEAFCEVIRERAGEE
jgi:hypothetical protein